MRSAGRKDRSGGEGKRNKVDPIGTESHLFAGWLRKIRMMSGASKLPFDFRQVKVTLSRLFQPDRAVHAPNPCFVYHADQIR